MHHQPHNTFGNKIINAVVYKDLMWLPHFHRSFELMVAIKGGALVTVDEKEYTLKEREMAIVFPYQSHSFTVRGDENALYVLVFSGDLMPAFTELAATKTPTRAKFTVEDFEWDFLCEALFKNAPGKYLLSAALSVVCGALVRQAEFCDRKESLDVVTKVISYVENNYREPITLKNAADNLGYNYQYLSRLFGSVMKMNFRDLVNQCRADEAEKLIASGRSVTEAAIESGFGSTRNFSRIVKKREKGAKALGSAPVETVKLGDADGYKRIF